METLSRDYDFHFHKATNESNPAGTYFGEPRVEVSLIMKGSVRFIVDGRMRVVHAPCATLQAYHVDLRASSNTDQKVQTMWCHFSPDALSEEDWLILENLPAAQPIPPLMPSLFAGALSLPQEADLPPEHDVTSHMRNSLGRTILAEYIRGAQLAGQSRPLPKAVSMAKKALDRDYSRPWTVGKLASLAGTNANYLIHLFKTYLGVPPMHYLWERRLDAGIHMLQSTSLTIDEISHRCGFQSPAHFSRRVKGRNGVPPSRFRQ
jgi:AraC-like DNA-binding protein